MQMSYRNKLLFVLIVAVAIIASVMIVISWMNSNEDIEGLRDAYGQETDNARGFNDSQKRGLEIYDTDYCQKNMTATAQRVCGKTDLLCEEHKGENEFWDGFCKTFPEELNKIK